MGELNRDGMGIDGRNGVSSNQAIDTRGHQRTINDVRARALYCDRRVVQRGRQRTLNDVRARAYTVTGVWYNENTNVHSTT